MNLQTIWNEINNTDPGIREMCLRLACAMIVGLVIGTEREYTHRPAGMRTHILVALGSCVVAIVGELIFRQYSTLGALPDPARLSAQVITGVGFLGAGTIMREGATVKGLTTAASLWAVACLGIAAGMGYYTLALAGMVVVCVTLTWLEVLQKKLMSKNMLQQSYSVKTEDVGEALKRIYANADNCHGVVEHLQMEQENGTYNICFQVTFNGKRGKLKNEQFMQALSAEKIVLHAHQTVSAL